MNINIEKAKNGYIVCIGHEDRFVFYTRKEVDAAIQTALDSLDEPDDPA